MYITRKLATEARIGYKSLTSNSVHGGGTLKYEVKKGLLHPVGKTAGLLRFNGTTLYIPEDRQITIGSAKDSDIRIVDSRIGYCHVAITSSEKGFLITDLSPDNEIAVRDKSTGKFSRLSSVDPYEMTGDGSIIFRLSGLGKEGNARLFAAELEVSRSDIVEEARALFDTPTPPIEHITTKQALAKAEQAEDSSAAMLETLKEVGLPDHKSIELVARIQKRKSRIDIQHGVAYAPLLMAQLIFLALFPMSSIYSVLNNVAFFALTVSFLAFNFALQNIRQKKTGKLEGKTLNVLDRLSDRQIAALLTGHKKEVQNEVISRVDFRAPHGNYSSSRSVSIRKELKLLAKGQVRVAVNSSTTGMRIANPELDQAQIEAQAVEEETLAEAEKAEAKRKV